MPDSFDKADSLRQMTFVRLQELRERYRDAHDRGMAALQQRDFDALSDAVDEEARILDEQRRLIDELRRQIRKPHPST